jgi:hypothetical protein
MTNYLQNETNNHEDDEDDYDDDYDDESLPIYEADEPSPTKFNLVICEPYNSISHGDINGEINNHYLTIIRFSGKYDYNLIRLIIQNYGLTFNNLQIAECLYLPSQHCVSILKTFWLKLIQRTWKKVYKNKQLINNRRCRPNALKYKEIYGRWPIDCLNYPTLKGMLSYLS